MNFWICRKLKKDYQKTADIDSLLSGNTTLIWMGDGKIRHGGLSDRLRGIVSTYAYAKKRDMNFRIYFVSPFPLLDYLVPNLYDWRISEHELNYEKGYSKPLYITSTSNQGDESYQEKFINKYAVGNQIHLYTNMYLADEEYTTLFAELFKPSVKLEEVITYHLKKINSNYIAITFRFQQLLGDFKEGNYPILSENKKTELIRQCKIAIEEIHNKYISYKVLVTSDSINFLKSISDLKYVYVVPEKVFHMDFSDLKGEEYPWLKSFLDMYLISFSEKVYLAYTEKMFNSGFAKRAAMISGIPYERYDF